jgi:hypothetical protein
MKTAVDASHCLGDLNRICDIAFNQIRGRRFVLDASSGQVIKDAHRLAICDKRIGEMGDDKTTSTSYKIIAHNVSVLFINNQAKTSGSRPGDQLSDRRRALGVRPGWVWLVLPEGGCCPSNSGLANARLGLPPQAFPCIYM